MVGDAISLRLALTRLPPSELCTWYPLSPALDTMNGDSSTTSSSIGAALVVGGSLRDSSVELLEAGTDTWAESTPAASNPGTIEKQRRIVQESMGIRGFMVE